MAINQWPLGERPREKLLHMGAATLSDAELLAVLLRTGRRGVTAVDLARELIERFGGLRPLLAASPETLRAAPGLGLARCAQLQAALELARRHLEQDLTRGRSLTSPSQTMAFLRARLRDLEHEVFMCLFLDNRNRVLRSEELFRGTIDGASVHPREVVKRALALNAAAVILAHNHPSGVAEPSRADELITRRLTDALALVDIRVLDHIVVGDGSPVSFAERGLL